MDFQRMLIYLKKHLTLICFTIILITGCGKDDQAPNEPVNTQTIQKSPKRGLAYNLTNPSDFEALKSGVTWWYNWSINTSAPAGYYDSYEMEFIPMLWGGNKSQDFPDVEEFILSHSEVKYLLVLNEPNLTDQANMSPYRAAQEWKKYEKVVSDLAAKNRTIYLVGPAMNWGTMQNYTDPVVWLDDFITSYIQQNGGNQPQIDYLAFHWYDYGLADQLDRLAKYGKKIWITEMANWNPNINSYAKQIQQMTEMVSICENRDDVFRYAWFIGRGFENKFTNLFNTAPGELNDLGKLYISLPYTKQSN